MPSNPERFILSSSPMKMFDQFLEEGSEAQSSATAILTGPNNNTESTGWTPYIDRVILGVPSNPNSLKASPVQNRQHQIQLQLQQAQQAQGLLGQSTRNEFQQRPQQSHSTHELQEQHQLSQQHLQQQHQQQQYQLQSQSHNIHNSQQNHQQFQQQYQQHNFQQLQQQQLQQRTYQGQQSQFVLNSSPQKFDVYQQHQQSQQMPQNYPQQSQPAPQYTSTAQSSNTEWIQMQTPGQADKSFKISDFFFDTPTLNQTDLNTLLAAENDNKENDPIFANFGTPLNHRSRFFKTPLKEFSNTPRLIGSTSVKKLSLSAVSASKHLSFQQRQSYDQGMLAQQTSETPSRSNYKTPLKPNHQQSSPSTIIMTSTKKVENRDKSASLELSPTPTAKSSIKTAPCQLVKSACSSEPVIGIFHDKKQSPPKGPQMSSFSSQTSTASNKKRPGNDQGSGAKFQIIFADMNTLKGNYSGSKQKKQKKLARSTTTNSVSTAQTKKQAITDSDVTHNDSNYKKQKNSNSLVKVNSVPVIMPSRKLEQNNMRVSKSKPERTSTLPDNKTGKTRNLGDQSNTNMPSTTDEQWMDYKHTSLHDGGNLSVASGDEVVGIPHLTNEIENFLEMNTKR